jgi:hypothetical protein
MVLGGGGMNESCIESEDNQVTVKKKDFRKPLLRKNPSQLKQMTAAAMGAEEEVIELQTKIRKLQREIRELKKVNKVNLKEEAKADESVSKLLASEPSDDCEGDLKAALDEAGPEPGDMLDK